MEVDQLNLEDLESEEAIALIHYDESNKMFVVNEEACEFLRAIEQPIGVIAVAGMYRTGKSYLLNRVLLGRNSGFGVGSTVNACTKGLWIWKKVVSGTTPDGDPINVIVVDSEGLGALDEDSNHDVRIFSLAILISSYFIYNSMGSIDENALQSLSLVINLTKHIQIKASGVSSDIDPEEYAPYFPSFMWVVRDFALQLIDSDGESITSKEYLEKALANQKGFSESIDHKNRIRRLLKSFFKERDCCCMVRPLTKEEDLQNLENKDLDSLRSEFVTQITQLRSKVMKRVKPKKLGGEKKLSGSMLAGLVKNYVEAINKGAVPSIENAWSYISKNECQKALAEAYENFNDEFTSAFEMNFPMYEVELKDMYKEAKVNAIEMFNDKAVGEAAEEFRGDLKIKFKQRYSQIRAENEKETRKQSQAYLHQYFAPIEDKLKNQLYNDFNEYEKDIKEIEVVFKERGPAGPNRESILQEFIIRALIDGCDHFLRTKNDELKLESTLHKEMTSKLEGRVQELKSDLQKLKDDSDMKVRDVENKCAQLNAKEQSMRESLNQLKNEKEENEKEWKVRIQAERQEI